MEHNKRGKKTVIFLSLIVLIFMVSDLLKKDNFFSEMENRILAQKPEFSAKKYFSGEYNTSYETYVSDQFVSRNLWIRLKTYVDIAMQKKEVNGVYIGSDDYLIEQHLPSNYPLELQEEKIVLLKQIQNKYPKMKVMLVPTADNILTDKLPNSAPFFDQREFLKNVKARMGERTVIDVFSILDEHSSESIYYKTDHHWTTLGAYYGYQAWVEARNKFSIKFEVEDLEAVTEDFLGTLHSKINLHKDGEEILIFPQTKNRAVKITYDFQTTSTSYYEEKYLKTKNKYGYFLDDTHGFVEIETGYHNGKELFLIKDSYANSMIPMLATQYEKIYVLDLRYFNGKLFDFMETMDDTGRMDVLVLYNCIHFLNEFKYN